MAKALVPGGEWQFDVGRLVDVCCWPLVGVVINTREVDCRVGEVEGL